MTKKLNVAVLAVRFDVEDVADELELYSVVGGRGDRPCTVDAVRVVARVVGRRDDGRGTAHRQLDRASAADRHPGVVETEPGRRLPV